LEELLAATGYQVEINHDQEDSEDGQEMPPLIDIPTPDLAQTSSAATVAPPINEENDSREAANPTSTPNHLPPASPTEVLSIIAQYDEDRVPQSPPSSPPQATPPSSDTDSGSATYRDPTLPQFRPDTVEQVRPNEIARQTNFLPLARAEQERFKDKYPETINDDSEEEEPDQAEPSNPKTLPAINSKAKPPSHDRLYQLWTYDRAAKDAEKRGGWGRLNYQEFQTMVKRFIKEGKGNQMDYLGSWIEFCIP